jgi:hypothetical protein
MQRYTLYIAFLFLVLIQNMVGSFLRRFADYFPGSCIQYVSYKWQKAQRYFYGTSSCLPVSFKEGQETSRKIYF